MQKKISSLFNLEYDSALTYIKNQSKLLLSIQHYLILKPMKNPFVLEKIITTLNAKEIDSFRPIHQGLTIKNGLKIQGDVLPILCYFQQLKVSLQTATLLTMDDIPILITQFCKDFTEYLVVNDLPHVDSKMLGMAAVLIDFQQLFKGIEFPETKLDMVFEEDDKVKLNLLAKKVYNKYIFEFGKPPNNQVLVPTAHICELLYIFGSFLNAKFSVDVFVNQLILNKPANKLYFVSIFQRMEVPVVKDQVKAAQPPILQEVRTSAAPQIAAIKQRDFTVNKYGAISFDLIPFVAKPLKLAVPSDELSLIQFVSQLFYTQTQQQEANYIQLLYVELLLGQNGLDSVSQLLPGFTYRRDTKIKQFQISPSLRQWLVLMFKLCFGELLTSREHIYQLIQFLELANSLHIFNYVMTQQQIGFVKPSE